MSSKIGVCSIVNSGNGNNWNIPEDWLDPFGENDDLFTFDPLSANCSDLAVQKINNQFEENGSSPKLRLYSQLNSSFLSLHSEWAGFEGSEYEYSAVSILANLKNYQVEEHEKFEEPGPNTKSLKKRLYSELDSLPASLDSEKLNNLKRIKFDNDNEYINSCQFYSDNFSSYYDDSLSSSNDIFHEDDLKSIWEWAKIENSIPSTHLSNDENSYSTCEMIDQPIEEYETIAPNEGTGVRLKVLNGKLIHHLIPDDATEKLRENLKTAKKIIRFVQDAVPFSKNYLQRSKIFSSNLYDFRSSAHLIERKVDRAIVTLRKEFNGPNIKSFAQAVRKIGSVKAGNCSEMSMTGLLLSYAKNQQPLSCAEMFDGGFDKVQKQAPVEMFEIPEPQGDHIFLVIDRDQRVPSSYYWLWGPDAVVCDVWSGAYYPASMVEQHLLDYAGFVYIDRISCPKVRNFDPSRQTLVVMRPASIQ